MIENPYTREQHDRAWRRRRTRSNKFGPYGGLGLELPTPEPPRQFKPLPPQHGNPGIGAR